MATTIITKNQEEIGCRFWGGDQRGVTIKLDLTKEEFANCKDVFVSFEFDDNFVSLNKFVNDWISENKTIEFENAHSLNNRAREIETCRWFGNIDVGFQLSKTADDLRKRAKASVKDSISIIN